MDDTGTYQGIQVGTHLDRTQRIEIQTNGSTFVYPYRGIDSKADICHQIAKSVSPNDLNGSLVSNGEHFSADFSLSFWIQPTADLSGTYYLFSTQNEDDVVTQSIWLQDNLIYVEQWDGTDVGIPMASSGLQQSTWSHVLYTYQNLVTQHSWRFFVNNSLLERDSHDRYHQVESYQTYLFGKDWSSGVEGFQGFVREVIMLNYWIQVTSDIEQNLYKPDCLVATEVCAQDQIPLITLADDEYFSYMSNSAKSCDTGSTFCTRLAATWGYQACNSCSNFSSCLSQNNEVIISANFVTNTGYRLTPTEFTLAYSNEEIQMIGDIYKGANRGYYLSGTTYIKLTQPFSLSENHTIFAIMKCDNQDYIQRLFGIETSSGEYRMRVNIQATKIVMAMYATSNIEVTDTSFIGQWLGIILNFKQSLQGVSIGGKSTTVNYQVALEVIQGTQVYNSNIADTTEQFTNLPTYPLFLTFGGSSSDDVQKFNGFIAKFSFYVDQLPDATIDTFHSEVAIENTCLISQYLEDGECKECPNCTRGCVRDGNEADGISCNCYYPICTTCTEFTVNDWSDNIQVVNFLFADLEFEGSFINDQSGNDFHLVRGTSGLVWGENTTDYCPRATKDRGYYFGTAQSAAMYFTPNSASSYAMCWSDTMTITGWINQGVQQVSQNHILLSYTNSEVSGKALEIRYNSFSLTTNNAITIQSTQSITLNSWTHFGFTSFWADNLCDMAFFIQDQLDSQHSGQDPFVCSFDGLRWLGNTETTGSDNGPGFVGFIREFTIYNYLREVTEILKSVQQDSSGHDLVYCPFNSWIDYDGSCQTCDANCNTGVYGCVRISSSNCNCVSLDCTECSGFAASHCTQWNSHANFEFHTGLVATADITDPDSTYVLTASPNADNQWHNTKDRGAYFDGDDLGQIEQSTGGFQPVADTFTHRIIFKAESVSQGYIFEWRQSSVSGAEIHLIQGELRAFYDASNLNPAVSVETWYEIIILQVKISNNDIQYSIYSGTNLLQQENATLQIGTYTDSIKIGNNYIGFIYQYTFYHYAFYPENLSGTSVLDSLSTWAATFYDPDEGSNCTACESECGPVCVRNTSLEEQWDCYFRACTSCTTWDENGCDQNIKVVEFQSIPLSFSDSQVEDTSGNDLHGEIDPSNSPIPTKDRGYYFDGTDQYIQLPRNAAQVTDKFTIPSIFTLTLWMHIIDEDPVSGVILKQMSGNSRAGTQIRVLNRVFTVWNAEPYEQLFESSDIKIGEWFVLRIQNSPNDADPASSSSLLSFEAGVDLTGTSKNFVFSDENTMTIGGQNSSNQGLKAFFYTFVIHNYLTNDVEPVPFLCNIESFIAGLAAGEECRTWDDDCLGTGCVRATPSTDISCRCYYRMCTACTGFKTEQCSDQLVILHYLFDKPALPQDAYINDLSGNQFYAKLGDGVADTTKPWPTKERGYYFDGVDDFMAIQKFDDYYETFAWPDTATFEFWIHLFAPSATKELQIMSSNPVMNPIRVVEGFNKIGVASDNLTKEIDNLAQWHQLVIQIESIDEITQSVRYYLSGECVNEDCVNGENISNGFAADQPFDIVYLMQGKDADKHVNCYLYQMRVYNYIANIAAAIDPPIPSCLIREYVDYQGNCQACNAACTITWVRDTQGNADYSCNGFYRRCLNPNDFTRDGCHDEARSFVIIRNFDTYSSTIGSFIADKHDNEIQYVLGITTDVELEDPTPIPYRGFYFDGAFDTATFQMTDDVTEHVPVYNRQMVLKLWIMLESRDMIILQAEDLSNLNTYVNIGTDAANFLYLESPTFPRQYAANEYNQLSLSTLEWVFLTVWIDDFNSSIRVYSNLDPYLIATGTLFSETFYKTNLPPVGYNGYIWSFEARDGYLYSDAQLEVRYNQRQQDIVPYDCTYKKFISVQTDGSVSCGNCHNECAEQSLGHCMIGTSCALCRDLLCQTCNILGLTDFDEASAVCSQCKENAQLDATGVCQCVASYTLDTELYECIKQVKLSLDFGNIQPNFTFQITQNGIQIDLGSHDIYRTNQPKATRNRGFYFNDNDYMLLPPNDLDTTPFTLSSDSFTLASWFRTERSENTHCIFCQYNTQDYTYLFFGLKNNKVALYYGNGTDEIGIDTIANMDRWLYVTIAFNFENPNYTVNIYIFKDSNFSDLYPTARTSQEVECCYDTTLTSVYNAVGARRTTDTHMSQYYRGFIKTLEIYQHFQSRYEVEKIYDGCTCDYGVCFSPLCTPDLTIDESESTEDCQFDWIDGCIRSDSCSLCQATLCHQCTDFETTNCLELTPYAADVNDCNSNFTESPGQDACYRIILHYTFQDFSQTVTDYSDFEYHGQLGTNTNAQDLLDPILITDQRGIYFNGQSCVMIDDGINVHWEVAFSLTFWFRFDVIGGDGYQSWVGRFDSAGAPLIQVQYYSRYNTIAFNLPGMVIEGIYLNGVVWTFLAAVYEGFNSDSILKLYTNTQLLTQGYFPGAVYTNDASAKTYLGMKLHDGITEGEEFLTGYMSNVIFYQGLINSGVILQDLVATKTVCQSCDQCPASSNTCIPNITFDNTPDRVDVMCHADCRGFPCTSTSSSDCVKCHDTCAQCDGSAIDNWLYCEPPREFESGRCTCPQAFIETEAVLCGCPSSQYYTPTACLPCSASWKECTGPDTNQCTECYNDLNLQDGICSSIVCAHSQYLDTTTQLCVDCSLPCLTCTESASNCTSCTTVGAYYLEASSCHDCDEVDGYEGLRASRAGSGPVGNWEEICGDGNNFGQHECDDGNLINGDGCDRYCELEQSECTGIANCDVTPPLPSIKVVNDTQIKIQFQETIVAEETTIQDITLTVDNIEPDVYSWVFISTYEIEFTWTTDIPTGTYVHVTFNHPELIQDEYGNVITTTDFSGRLKTYSLNEATSSENNEAAEVASNSSEGAFGGLLVLSTLMQVLSSAENVGGAAFWTSVEVAQSIKYLQFVNFPFPSHLQTFFEIFGIGSFNYIPNMLKEGGAQTTLEGKLSTRIDANFLDNSGQILIVISGLCLAYGVLILLSKKWPGPRKKFEFSAFIRVFEIIYMHVALTAMCTLVADSTGTYSLIVAWLFIPFVVGYPVLILWTLNQYPGIKKRETKYVEKFGSWFEDVDCKRFFSRNHAVIKAFRRLLYIGVIALFQDSPTFQLSFLGGLFFTTMLWLVTVRPFLVALDFWINIICETVLFIVAIMLGLLKSYDNEESEDSEQLGWMIIILCASMISILATFVMIQSLVKVCQLAAKKCKKTQPIAPDPPTKVSQYFPRLNVTDLTTLENEDNASNTPYII